MVSPQALIRFFERLCLYLYAHFEHGNDIVKNDAKKIKLNEIRKYFSEQMLHIFGTSRKKKEKKICTTKPWYQNFIFGKTLNIFSTLVLLYDAVITLRTKIRFFDIDVFLPIVYSPILYITLLLSRFAEK